jgi:protein phosphatase PTC1
MTTPPLPISFISECEEMNASHRRTMEDTHCIIQHGFNNDPQCAFFAVFDGHGGRGVAEYLSTTLNKNIEIEMRENAMGTIQDKLTSAFLFSDIQSSTLPSTIGMGSTAAILLLRKEDDEQVVYAANVGDTRAVLYHSSKQPQLLRLTFDHKATDPGESKRIERMGGTIARKRVMGVLSVSRSFGDFELKKYVVARPYTSRTVLTKNPNKNNNNNAGFIILACDGLWDVFTDEEAGDFVRNALNQDSSWENKQTIAEKLVTQALKKGTTDNVTCLVIGL